MLRGFCSLFESLLISRTQLFPSSFALIFRTLSRLVRLRCPPIEREIKIEFYETSKSLEKQKNVTFEHYQYGGMFDSKPLPNDVSAVDDQTTMMSWEKPFLMCLIRASRGCDSLIYNFHDLRAHFRLDDCGLISFRILFILFWFLWAAAADMLKVLHQCKFHMKTANIHSVSTRAVLKHQFNYFAFASAQKSIAAS